MRETIATFGWRFFCPHEGPCRENVLESPPERNPLPSRHTGLRSGCGIVRETAIPHSACHARPAIIAADAKQILEPDTKNGARSAVSFLAEGVAASMTFPDTA